MRDLSLIAAMFSTFSTFLLPNKDKVADTHSLSLSESPSPPSLFFACSFFFSHSLSLTFEDIIFSNTIAGADAQALTEIMAFILVHVLFFPVDVVLMLFLIKKACVQVKQHREDIFVIPLRFGCVVRHDVKKQ